MAGERQVNNQVAQDLVRENLGLSADDLGMDRPDTFADMDLGDEGDEDIDINARQHDDFGDMEAPEQIEQPQQRQQPDDLSVTHTPQPQERPIGQEFKADKKGNIIGKDGKIVAFAGREARLFTEHHKLRGQLGQITQQANTRINDFQQRLNQAVDIGMRLSERVKALVEQGTVASKAGLSEPEHQQAIQLAVQAKTDPVGALKVLLTRAHAAGIDLTSLGLQPGGFDTKSLMDMVRQEIANGVKPVQQRMQQETDRERQVREQQESQERVNTELRTFLGQNPEARNWLPAFKEIYARPELQHMSLGEVWSRLQLNLLRRGIDPANPPRPQQQQRSPNPQQRRMPSGRGNPPGGGHGRVQPMELAPVSDSYEDIVRGVLGNG
ncbi:MAG TPA: hypothetical protein VIY48_07465 [Candidatus Paceibacterota bacterium]